MDERARSVVKNWAKFDLLLNASYATPLTLGPFLSVTYFINGLLGGISSAPALSPLNAFFMNLAGMLGVVWALGRIANPLRQLGLIDATARLVVSALILYYVFAQSAPPALLLIIVSEVAGAFMQFSALKSTASD